MVTPVITPLPPAPTRADGANDFSAKADALAAAWPPNIVQLNASYVWVAQQVAAALGYRNAADLSAQAAAGSVTAAAEQVGLAVQARQGSEIARDQARVYAQAAGAGAGIPPPEANMFLGTDANGNPVWKSAGQSIGDTLITSLASPPTGYILPDTVYSRAAYPELFAVVGTIGANNDGVGVSQIAHGLTPGSYKFFCTRAGTFIAINSDTSFSPTGALAARSTDGGLSWASIPSLAGKRSLKAIDQDATGALVCVGVGSTSGNDSMIYRSVDDGQTWVEISSIPYAYNGVPPSIVSFGSSSFIAYTTGQQSSTQGSISTDGGITWPSYTVPAGIQAVVDAGGGSLAAITLVSGAVTLQALMQGSAGFATSASYGTSLFSGMTSSPTAGVLCFSLNGALQVSQDFGKTFKPSMQSPNGGAYIDRSNTLFLRSCNRVIATRDFGDTWEYVTEGIQLQQGVASRSDGVWMCTGLSNTTFRRSTRQFNYDTATQFKTPAIKAPRNLKAYIKAKAA